MLICELNVPPDLSNLLKRIIIDGNLSFIGIEKGSYHKSTRSLNIVVMKYCTYSGEKR